MSRKIVIDRFEGTYAICEDKDQKFFAIEIAELPQGAKEGHVIEIKDDGTLAIDQKETDLRREKNKKFRGFPTAPKARQCVSLDR